MTETHQNNGRIPTDPMTVITGLFLLYAFITQLTPDQRDNVNTLIALAPLIAPLLTGRR